MSVFNTGLALLGEIMSYDAYKSFPENLRERIESFIAPYDISAKPAVAQRDRSILVLAADRVCNNCGLSTRPCDQTCEIIKTIMGVNR